MTQLQKTRAIVLRKMDFRDTSKIVTLYTEKHGKQNVIIKGARSKKSKIGAIIDVLNFVNVVIYNKDSREIQLVTQADLVSHFPKIKDDLEKLKYASAVCELLQSLTIENEVNLRLFNGSVKMLGLINDGASEPAVLFAKYFLFFIEESGYSLIRDNCTYCGKELKEDDNVSYNYELGFLCSDCSKNHLINYEFSKELFEILYCLSSKQEFNYTKGDIEKIIYFLERFIKYHIQEFKGVRSLKLY